MNATDFIKHYGLNTAIRITEDSKNDDFWDTETAFYTDKNSESCVCISEVKRIVESVDLVNLKGGVKKLKKEADCLFHNDVEGVALRYEQAVADYEEIAAGHRIDHISQEGNMVHDLGDDSHIENHVSPLCKVGVK